VPQVPLDDIVVAAACRNDPEALRAVYLELAPSVLGYLRAKGVADPEAVTNDVFVALLPQLPRLRGGAAGLRRLTFSIAHARIVDEHRSRVRAPAAVPYEPERDERAVPPVDDVLDAGRVRELLAVLPDDQQEVLRLRVIADLSIEQVAAVMNRSAGAVKQLQRRALLTLRAALVERRVTR
jgi:RNA polymerase sigma-70 factor (ECF subfamily)